jgi:hypothetical protein
MQFNNNKNIEPRTNLPILLFLMGEGEFYCWFLRVDRQDIRCLALIRGLLMRSLHLPVTEKLNKAAPVPEEERTQ